MPDAFEWDAEKAETNFAGHGVEFELATRVFRDPLAIELLDDRYDYGEDRYVLIGSVDGVVLTVVYVEREERRRLISARVATRREHDEYFKQGG
jgi:hypothetical protein